MSVNRRGFLKLLGAATAVPIIAQAGLPMEALAAPREILLPAGSVVETLATASTIADAVRQAPTETWMRGDDEWEWRERYRARVRHEIEIEEYERITFVINAAAYKRSSIAGFRGYTTGTTYELAGPIIGRRTAALSVDDAVWEGMQLPPVQRIGSEDQARALGSTRHAGIAHVVARQIGLMVEEDVLTQLLSLRAANA